MLGVKSHTIQCSPSYYGSSHKHTISNTNNVVDWLGGNHIGINALFADATASMSENNLRRMLRTLRPLRSTSPSSAAANNSHSQLNAAATSMDGFSPASLPK